MLENVESSKTPTRLPLPANKKLIARFMADNTAWVIEGCYSSLLGYVMPHTSEIIFLNPGVETCIANSNNRPWEPHKYESPAAQAANAEMLVAWITEYDLRDDEFSLAAHRRLFDAYNGTKSEYSSNARPD
ncbi:shikimate kinase [bacterium]|nr:MAG: shikimate kinase [bacterium]